MAEITEITRRDIFDLLRKGYSEENLWGDNVKHFYPYYGRLQEIEFLKRLYPIDIMPSTDNRFESAEADIFQHTQNNEDWAYGWVFQDSRFGLLDGADSILLRFICEVFNPVCRVENGDWQEFYNKINDYLKNDGFELYQTHKISGRSVFGWRKLTSEEILTESFVPFSIRHKEDFESKRIEISIPRKLRKEILELMNSKESVIDRTAENGWNYEVSTSEAVFEDIREFYSPHSFSETREYVETSDFSSFIMSNYPEKVLDAIEVFAEYADEMFTFKVNSLMKKFNFPYVLIGGKFERDNFEFSIPTDIPEKGLRELMDEAIFKYRSEKISDKKEAAEKIWDALERLKSYYSALDKKRSVEKIIEDISNQEESYVNLFNDEFNKLTKIGNNYRIRHHEMNKIEIIDDNYFEYFFLRCFALVNLSIKYLKNDR